MKKTLTPRRAVCGLLAALAAAAAVWLLCRWVGYDLQLRLGDKQQFEIVNDDYSQIIDVPDEGLVQTFPLKAGQSICGSAAKRPRCGSCLLYTSDAADE